MMFQQYVSSAFPNALNLNLERQPTPVAFDLPKSKYIGKIDRDEWMTELIASVFELNPNTKMLMVVGNNHILKKLNWQDHVANKHWSIRQYLSKKRRKLRMVSIGKMIEESVCNDDFHLKFGQIDGAVTVDLDKRFAGWRLGIVESVAIKRGEVWELLEGVIVH